MSLRHVVAAAGLGFGVLLGARAACAQEQPGASVAGIVAATDVNSHADWSFAGSFGYQFNSVVGWEIEATAVPHAHSEAFNDRVVIQAAGGVLEGVVGSTVGTTIFPTPLFQNQRSRIVIVTNNARLTIPTTVTRVAPYFVGGGGVAQMLDSADYTYQLITGVTPTPSPVGIVPLPTFRTVTQPVKTATTQLALMLGGGVAIKTTEHLAVEVDLRVFRLLGSEDTNAGRFGVGARYRF